MCFFKYNEWRNDGHNHLLIKLGHCNLHHGVKGDANCGTCCVVSSLRMRAVRNPMKMIVLEEMCNTITIVMTII